MSVSDSRQARRRRLRAGKSHKRIDRGCKLRRDSRRSSRFSRHKAKLWMRGELHRYNSIFRLTPDIWSLAA